MAYIQSLACVFKFLTVICVCFHSRFFLKKVLFQDLHPIIVETFTDTLKVGGVVREMPK